MKTDKRSFRKMFPNLSKELEREDTKVAINSVRTNPINTEKPEFQNYKPTVVDFIRRCDTETQAETIISYLEKRGELTKKQTKKLRRQLKNSGVRSFGPKKEEYYYFKQSGIC